MGIETFNTSESSAYSAAEARLDALKHQTEKDYVSPDLKMDAGEFDRIMNKSVDDLTLFVQNVGLFLHKDIKGLPHIDSNTIKTIEDRLKQLVSLSKDDEITGYRRKNQYQSDTMKELVKDIYDSCVGLLIGSKGREEESEAA